MRAVILKGALLLLALCSALAQSDGSGGDGSENEGDQYMMVDDILSGNEYYAALEVRGAGEKHHCTSARMMSYRFRGMPRKRT